MIPTSLSPDEEIRQIVARLPRAPQPGAPPPSAPAPDATTAAPAPVIAPPTPKVTPIQVSPQQQTDQAELDRLKNSPSGVEQLQHKHPIIGTIARIGTAALSSLFPTVATNIPGTEMHHAQLVNRAQGRVANDITAGQREAQTANENADVPLKAAQTHEAEARANSLEDPQDKTGQTPDEVTLHDLMAGDNGRPRINPQTGKPYSYLEAYTAVKQAAQDVKPDKPDNETAEAQRYEKIGVAKRLKQPVSPEDEAWAATYEKRKTLAPFASAVAQAPERATQRADRSYQYHSTQLERARQPIDSAVQRLGRLQDTLSQGNPQADALVAPELLTVMAGGQGSGLRMNEAEISRIVGGRSAWENLRAKLQHWGTNPDDARSITPEQDKQIRSLVETVNQKLLAKQKAINDAENALVDSDDPVEHRRIVNDARRALDAIDSGNSTGGGSQEVEYVRGTDGKLHPKQ